MHIRTYTVYLYIRTYMYVTLNSTFTDKVKDDPQLTELAVFEENYALLCNTITDVIDPLTAWLVKRKHLTIENREVVATPGKSESLQPLLLVISSYLKANNTKCFYTMLKIMREQGGKGTQTLADHIMNRLKISVDKLANICLSDYDDNIHQENNMKQTGLFVFDFDHIPVRTCICMVQLKENLIPTGKRHTHTCV